MMPWFSTANGEAYSQSTAKRCILVWLDGGPSHLDMFDPKPNAPVEVRGPFSSIATKIPGVRFSELMPGLAARADELAVIRSMTSPLGEHNLGAHYLLTGYKPSPVLEYPAFSSVLNHLQPHDGSLPQSVAIPDHRVGGANFSAMGFLGRGVAPFELQADPAKPNFRVRDLTFHPTLDRQRIARRESLLRSLEALNAETPVIDRQFEQAFRLLRSKEAQSAFDLSREPETVRRRYGSRSIGQSCLLARRLVERGVSFVTVKHSGWDTHQQLVTRLKDGFSGAKQPVGLVPSLDTAVSALLDDLKSSGLLDETLVVVMGEFGRTPKLNIEGGRDHWPRCFSVMLAGGGVKAGAVYGQSDPNGESPDTDPVTPAMLLATIYRLMGVDPATRLTGPNGRPISLADGQSAIEALIG